MTDIIGLAGRKPTAMVEPMLSNTKISNIPAPALKDKLNAAAVTAVADVLAACSDDFNRRAFLESALNGLADLSLMERLRHIATALSNALDCPYPDALDVLQRAAPKLHSGFVSLIPPEVVVLRGQDDIARSLGALAFFTGFGTAEFAIRPFLLKHTDQTLHQMRAWATSEDPHIRRLASEGSRPRLPWATRIPALTQSPALAEPILDALRTDPSEYVRRSVANHLNDISRAHPEWLLAKLETWDQSDPATRRIVKHSLRSLIKAGDPRALALVGADIDAAVEVDEFRASPPALSLGDWLTLCATVRSTSSQTQRIVVDYAVHYPRREGKFSRKVFKLRTLILAPDEAVSLQIRQQIRDFTTRKHYPGEHTIELLINGRIAATAGFLITSLFGAMA